MSGQTRSDADAPTEVDVVVKLLRESPVVQIVAAVSDLLDAAVVLKAQVPPVDYFVNMYMRCSNFSSILMSVHCRSAGRTLITTRCTRSRPRTRTCVSSKCRTG